MQGSTSIEVGSDWKPRYTGPGEAGVGVVISSAVEAKDLRDAERLGRYRYSLLLRFFQEKEIWFFAYAAVAVLLGNIAGRVHGQWRLGLLSSGLAAGGFALRWLWVEAAFRRKAKKMSRDKTRYELTDNGVRFHMPDRSIRQLGWERILEARATDRILTLHYRPTGRWKRRKYFILPLTQLEPAQRVNVVEFVPQRIRSESIGRALAGWKLR